MKNRTFYIQLAEKVIEIHSDSDYLLTMCRQYICEPGNAVITAEADAEDIQFEIDKHLERNHKVKVSGREDVFESLAVYRQIAEQMIDFGTLLMHGSAIAVDGECYLFCAESGTGKSTHTRLWREYFAERAVMINDDKPLIQTGERINVFGTPWSGKHHLDTNMSAPLKAICFLARGEENEIHRIDKDDALIRLLRYSYHSEQPQRLHHSISLLMEILEKVPMYSLQCNMNPDAAAVSFNGMQK